MPDILHVSYIINRFLKMRTQIQRNWIFQGELLCGNLIIFFFLPQLIIFFFNCRQKNNKPTFLFRQIGKNSCLMCLWAWHSLGGTIWVWPTFLWVSSPRLCTPISSLFFWEMGTRIETPESCLSIYNIVLFINIC